MFPQDSFEEMMKPGREAFEYWISFFPTAPMFGVEWRFGDMMKGMDNMSMMPGMEAMSAFTAAAPAAAAKTAPKPAPKPAAKTNGAAKPTPAPAAEVKAAAVAVEKTAPKPVAEKAPAKKAAPAKAAAPKAAAAKPAAKKAAAPKPANTSPKVKAEADPAKAKAVKAPAKAKDGTPEGLLAEKPAKIDDLKLIKGVGPGLEKQLNGLGIYQFEQVAGFSKSDLTWVDDNLTAFKGRCFRDDWIGQAKDLIG